MLRDVLMNRAGRILSGVRFFLLRFFCTHPMVAVTLWMKYVAGSARPDSHPLEDRFAQAR
jgi:hypothetical protein